MFSMDEPVSRPPTEEEQQQLLEGAHEAHTALEDWSQTTEAWEVND